MNIPIRELFDDILNITNKNVTYGINLIEANEVWKNYNVKGEGVNVSVLDTGVDADHSDISISKWKDFSFSDEEEPFDPLGHGTHVIGTIAGKDNSNRSIGVAPKASIYAGKVCSSSGICWVSDIINGIQWSVRNNADIISISLGGSKNTSSTESYMRAINNTKNMGTVVVAAIGNQGPEESHEPGVFWDTISVGAINKTKKISQFPGNYSSSGEKVNSKDIWGYKKPSHYPDNYITPDVVAPGSYIYSSYPGDVHLFKSGTSMATPHVSATLALGFSARGESFNTEEVRDMLKKSSFKPKDKPNSKDIRYGYGIINSQEFVKNSIDNMGVRGKVSYLSNNSLSNAEIYVDNNFKTRTNTEGRYKINLPKGKHKIFAKYNNYSTDNYTINVDTDEIVTKNLTFKYVFDDEGSDGSKTRNIEKETSFKIINETKEIKNNILEIGLSIKNNGKRGEKEVSLISDNFYDKTSISIGYNETENVYLFGDVSSLEDGRYNYTIKTGKYSNKKQFTIGNYTNKKKQDNKTKIDEFNKIDFTYQFQNYTVQATAYGTEERGYSIKDWKIIDKYNSNNENAHSITSSVSVRNKIINWIL